MGERLVLSWDRSHKANLEEENPDNPGNRYLHFYCKIWSPVVGLWDSLERWVLMFLRTGITSGNTGLGAYLYLHLSLPKAHFFHGANLQVVLLLH